VSTESHLQAAKGLLYDHYLPQCNIHEFFMADSADIIQKFEEKILSSGSPEHSPLQSQESLPQLKLIPDANYGRLKATVDMDVAMRLYNTPKHDCGSEKDRYTTLSSHAKSRIYILVQ
jgi:glycogen debranching enzyme